MTTPKLQMPELSVGQAGKELTHNQALAVLDQLAQAVVVDKDLTSEPGSPANGAMYIVAAGATGAWANKDGKLAFWLTSIGVWTFAVPTDGWTVFVSDEASRYTRVGGAWVIDQPVTGAVSSVDNDVARFSGAAGKSLKAGLKYQTSTSDTTSGALSIVGAFGIGGASLQLTDIDSITPQTGFYFASNTAAGTPPIASTFATIEVARYASSNSIYQIWRAVGNVAAAGRSFIRVYDSTGAVWMPWAEQWHSKAINEVTVDAGGVGFGVGSGGTALQATSKSTTVPLNKPTGQITMHGAALLANTSVSFTVTNNKIAAADVPTFAIKSGATGGAYVLQVDAVAAGSCRVSIRNVTGGSLSESVVLQFSLIKGAIA